MIFFSFSLTVDEILRVLEEPVDSSDSETEAIHPEKIEEVIIFPPEDGQDTDEDSDIENDGDLNHLSARQLRSHGEVIIESFTEEDSFEAAGAEPPKKKSKKKPRTWKKAENFVPNLNIADMNLNDVQSMTCVESFEKIFTDEIFDYLVEMSNKYAEKKNQVLDVNKSEMKIYVAILLLTGYMTPKYIRMFWEQKEDVHNKGVAQSMRRNRFLQIHQYLHTCDNDDLPAGDKFGKLAKYFELLNKSYKQNFETFMSNNISIDETMIPYYGRQSCKQHIHGKPLRFGYKLWSACTSDGYLIQFIPYQGAHGAKLKYQAEYGLGAAVVLELLERLPENVSYKLYCDNFFTSLPLVDKMSEMKHGYTGTIRENRTEKCPLPGAKKMKKTKRGAIEMQVTSDAAVVQWHDNSIVTMASNIFGKHPISQVPRVGFVEKKRTKLTVPCPNIIKEYNAKMGGVDRFDQNVHSMRVSFRGKKWWYPLFAFGIDSACQNAWKLHQKYSDGEKYTYCQFRRSIVQSYFQSHKAEPSKSLQSGTKLTSRVSDAVRKNGSINEHVEEPCNQRRCAYCRERTRLQCKKCQVPLHQKCWWKFHA